MGPPCQALAQTNELIQDTGPCHMLACQGRTVCSLLLAPSAEAQLPAERCCVLRDMIVTFAGIYAVADLLLPQPASASISLCTFAEHCSAPQPWSFQAVKLLDRLHQHLFALLCQPQADGTADLLGKLFLLQYLTSSVVASCLAELPRTTGSVCGQTDTDRQVLTCVLVKCGLKHNLILSLARKLAVA